MELACGGRRERDSLPVGRNHGVFQHCTPRRKYGKPQRVRGFRSTSKMEEQERGSCETQQRSGSQKHRRMVNLLSACCLFVLGELRQVPALREGNQDGICFSFVLVVRAKSRT